MTEAFRPPFDWSKVTSLDWNPIFDDAVIHQLFQTVGLQIPNDKTDSAGYYLRHLTANFAFELWEERQPTPAQQVMAAKRLSKLCSQVLQVVGAQEGKPAGDSAYPFLGQLGLPAAAAAAGELNAEASIKDLLQGVQTLRDYADWLAMVEGRAAPNPGRRDSRATKKFIAGLASLYFVVSPLLPVIKIDRLLGLSCAS